MVLCCASRARLCRSLPAFIGTAFKTHGNIGWESYWLSVFHNLHQPPL